MNACKVQWKLMNIGAYDVYEILSLIEEQAYLLHIRKCVEHKQSLCSTYSEH